MRIPTTIAKNKPVRSREPVDPSTLAPYLGSALVLAVEGTDTVTVQLCGGPGITTSAQMALSLPYEPQVGDLLLTIGMGQGYFVIGVITGAGKTQLHFSGDVDLRAVGGTLKLGADDGIELTSTQVTIRADEVRTFARSLSEKVQTAYRWTKGLLNVRAGEARRVVDGEDRAHSKRAVILAEEVVKIDGGQVQLGH